MSKRLRSLYNKKRKENKRSKKKRKEMSQNLKKKVKGRREKRK